MAEEKRAKAFPATTGLLLAAPENFGSNYSETTLGLHANVQVRTGGLRPEILPHQTEHQLIKDWENGIALEEAEKRIETAINNAGQQT